MRRFSILGIAVAALALAAVRPCGASAGAGSIVPVSPHPAERVSSTKPAIVVQVTGVGALDGVVHLTVDGRDVSDGLSISGDRVTYKPPSALTSGLHGVQVDVDDAGGSRLSYQWSFTVDGPATTQSTDQRAAEPAGDAASAPAAAPPLQPASDGSDIPSYPPLNAALGDSGPPFGYPNFGLYALTPPPYYWGQNVPFVFNGIGGGNGFVTFGGIPGFFNLQPLGVNTYYVVVPIPVGFSGANPPVVCHFFTPTGSPAIVQYHRQVAIVGRRQPAVVHVALAHATSASRTSSLRMATGARTAPGARSFVTLRPTPALRPGVRNAVYLPGRVMRSPVGPGFGARPVAPGFGARPIAMPASSRGAVTVR